MFNNYELLLLKRFLFSKKTDGYISIFSWFSILGIMIGVAVIIIVMSVMNGFREELTSRLLGINGHINVYSTQKNISLSDVNEIIKFQEKTFQYFPMIETQALIINDENSKGVFLRSYLSKDLKNKHIVNRNIFKGRMYEDEADEVIIGYSLANQLNIDVGNKI